MSALARRITRRTLPRAVVLASRMDVRGRVAGAVRRRGGVELYFAFDDPCSAVALLDLSARLATREADLILLPVVQRGIPDDPAVEAKRHYAVDDARRLAARSGQMLGRSAPIERDAVAPVAAWVAGATPGPPLDHFCAEAMRTLWFAGDGPVSLDPLERCWRELGLGDPTGDEEKVRVNERRMRGRGPYDVPAAWVHGQWFFAQDRGPQIADRLDALGFGARAA